MVDQVLGGGRVVEGSRRRRNRWIDSGVTRARLGRIGGDAAAAAALGRYGLNVCRSVGGGGGGRRDRRRRGRQHGAERPERVIGVRLRVRHQRLGEPEHLTVQRVVDRGDGKRHGAGLHHGLGDGQRRRVQRRQALVAVPVLAAEAGERVLGRVLRVHRGRRRHRRVVVELVRIQRHRVVERDEPVTDERPG